jgi:hypothetical protein
MKTKLQFIKTILLMAALLQGCGEKEVIPEKLAVLKDAYVVELTSESDPDRVLSMSVLKDRLGTAMVNTIGDARGWAGANFANHEGIDLLEVGQQVEYLPDRPLPVQASVFALGNEERPIWMVPFDSSMTPMPVTPALRRRMTIQMQCECEYIGEGFCSKSESGCTSSSCSFCVMRYTSVIILNSNRVEYQIPFALVDAERLIWNGDTFIYPSREMDVMIPSWPQG